MVPTWGCTLPPCLSRRLSQRTQEVSRTVRGHPEPAASAAGKAATPGWRSLFSGGNAGRSIVLTSGVVLHGFFMFITSTVLPSIVAEIGGVAYYAWVSTVFGIGSIAGAMLTPAILRGLPARRAYELGLLLFVGGSICCAMAPDMAVVILGRAIQGFAGGLLAAIATSMIPVLFPDQLRSRAIALVSSVWGRSPWSVPSSAASSLSTDRGAAPSCSPYLSRSSSASWPTACCRRGAPTGHAPGRSFRQRRPFRWP